MFNDVKIMVNEDLEIIEIKTGRVLNDSEYKYNPKTGNIELLYYCSCCKKMKIASKFYQKEDGIQGICKKCRSEMHKRRNVEKPHLVGFSNTRLRNLHCVKLHDVKDEWAEFVMEEIYLLRNERTLTTKITWEVDHIVPISSSEVSGLHVWYNLQLLPKEANLLKSNKLGL